MARLSFDTRAGSIVIPVEIVGKEGGEPKALQLALDTGSSYTVLPWAFALSAGLQPEIFGERVGVTTASGVEYPHKVFVHRIRALGESLTNFEVLCHDLPPESRAHGLLGLNFLSRFDLSVNYSDGTIELKRF